MADDSGSILGKTIPSVLAALVTALCISVAGSAWPWLNVRLFGTSAEFEELKRRTVTFNSALAGSPLHIGKVEGPLTPEDWNTIRGHIQTLANGDASAAKESVTHASIHELHARMGGPDGSRNAIGVIDRIRDFSPKSDEIGNGSMRTTLAKTLNSLNVGAETNMVSWWVRGGAGLLVMASFAVAWIAFSGKRGSKPIDATSPTA